MDKTNTQQQDNIQAEIARLRAETSKLNSGHRVYLFVGPMYTLAIIAIVELLL